MFLALLGITLLPPCFKAGILHLWWASILSNLMAKTFHLLYHYSTSFGELYCRFPFFVLLWHNTLPGEKLGSYVWRGSSISEAFNSFRAVIIVLVPHLSPSSMVAAWCLSIHLFYMVYFELFDMTSHWHWLFFWICKGDTKKSEPYCTHRPLH